MPLVTIAIPTYDRLAYLKEAVDSALAQTYPHIEVVISDDGHQPDIAAFGRSLARTNTRVRYQRNPRTLGLAGNWNAAVALARGEYVIIIGDDDRLLPHFVERLLEIAGGADVVFSNQYLIDATGARLEAESVELTRRFGRYHLPAGPVLRPGPVVWSNSVPMSAALVRTAAVRRLGFKEDLNTPEIEMFTRLVAEGAHFAFCPEYLAEYRTHSGSMTVVGHKTERLVPYLEVIPVDDETEPYKRQYIEPLLIDAVGRTLAAGKTMEARRLYDSCYYPPWFRLHLKVLVQRTCLALPGKLGIWSYRGLRAASQRFTRTFRHYSVVQFD